MLAPLCCVIRLLILIGHIAPMARARWARHLVFTVTHRLLRLAIVALSVDHQALLRGGALVVLIARVFPHSRRRRSVGNPASSTNAFTTSAHFIGSVLRL